MIAKLGRFNSVRNYQQFANLLDRDMEVQLQRSFVESVIFFQRFKHKIKTEESPDHQEKDRCSFEVSLVFKDVEVAHREVEYDEECQIENCNRNEPCLKMDDWYSVQ